MMKAGASYRDKGRIRKMYLSNEYTLPQISALVSVKLEHVQAIVRQVDAGTLRLSGAKNAIPVGRMGGGAAGRIGEGKYGEGEDDTSLPRIEQGAAERLIEDSREAERQELQRALVEAQEKLAKQKAKKLAKKARKDSKKAEPVEFLTEDELEEEDSAPIEEFAEDETELDLETGDAETSALL